MTSPLGLEPGTVIGRDFRVLRHLASGAMGSVYIVEQLSTGKQRALKLMSIELANNDRARERFVLEARIGANIESDHVVEVVTAGIDEATGAPYLVMELLRGEELADMAYRVGPMPLRDVAEILKQAGHALGKAHEQGIVHRDIKPENLFIAESRREGVPFTVKILDFGIAKLVAERTSEGTQPVGTPLFMAPEQTDRRGLIAPTTDVWPLGLIAFYLLTGQHYWQCVDEGITTLLREVVLEPLVPASQRAAQLGIAQYLPPGFDAWFDRCVNRDPSRRFQEGAACAAAFQPLAGHGTQPQAYATGEAASPVARTVAAPELFGTGSASNPGASLPGAQSDGAAGHTGLTAAHTMGAAPPKSKAPLVLGAAVVLAGIGAAGYFATAGAGGSETQASAPADSGPPAASSAPVADAAPCPEGMVLIEGGKMFMGSTDTDLADDVRPAHRVTVSRFCLDVREVTAARYDACSGAGNCLRAPTTVSAPGIAEDQVPAYSALCNSGKADRADHPINCIDWNMAKTYCEIDGGRLPDGGARLPTEAEWEFAARGSSQKTYPWGDEPPGPTRLNACGSECLAWHRERELDPGGQMFEGDDGHAGTAPVGSYEAGASEAKIMDLAGNVWEWTADWYGPYTADEHADPKGADSGTTRVVRGGGFNGIMPGWAKPAFRWHTDPTAKSHGIGFRCAMTPKEGTPK